MDFMPFCAIDNKELWLMVLNQTGLLLYPKALAVLDPLFALHTNDITSDTLQMTVFVIAKLRMWRIYNETSEGY